MVIKKINRYKLLYKNLLSLRGPVLNCNKVLRFKKNKWKTFLFHLHQKEKKSILFYRVFDQEAYLVPKFTSLFRRRFSKNLQNKRRLSLYYRGLTEKKLKQLIDNSIKKSSLSNSSFSTQSYLLEFLESRLDIIILRSHIVFSIRNAQQLILHGHVFVNGACVTKKHYLVKVGDIIEFSSSIHEILVNNVSQSNLWPIPPKYMQVNYRIFQIIIHEEFRFQELNIPKHTPGISILFEGCHRCDGAFLSHF